MNSLILCTMLFVPGDTTPVDAAIADTKTIHVDSLKGTRYFVFPDDLEEKEYVDWYNALSFTINSISRSRAITKPISVDKRIARINIGDYLITKERYNSLKNAYFKGKNVDELNKILDCDNAIIRADWFIINALKAPLYYELLGVRNFKEFKELVAYDEKAGAFQEAALVMISNVVRNEQVITRTPTVLGYFYESYTSEDPIQNLLNTKFDASEIIATLPNNLAGYYSQRKGQGQDYLDPKSAVYDGKVIYSASTCIKCHASGPTEFKDALRELVKQDDNVTLHTASKEIAQRFAGDMSKRLKRDQQDYQEAVKKTTNAEFKPAESIDRITEYYNKPLTKERAAKELGVSTETLDKVCKASVEFSLVRLHLRGVIERRYWEQVIGGIK